MRKLFIRLLDWVSYKLDESACKALDKSRMQDVPAPKTPPGPKTGLLPDGYFAPGDCITYEYIWFTTPDRPENPIRREIDALTGRQEAVRYPRGS